MACMLGKRGLMYIREKGTNSSQSIGYEDISEKRELMQSGTNGNKGIKYKGNHNVTARDRYVCWKKGNNKVRAK